MPLRRMIIVIVLSACACQPVSQMPEVDPGLAAAEAHKQRELALQDRVSKSQRLASVADRILIASAALCGEGAAYKPGFSLTNTDSFSDEFRAAARSALGMDHTVRIVFVTAGGAAETAGLKPGDALTILEDWSVPTGKDAVKQFGERFRSVTKDRGSGEVTLAVTRDGQSRTVRVSAPRGCDVGTHLEVDDKVNAYADGRTIHMTTGMMRFTENDVELATVVGHEIAHNLMGHIDKKKSNETIGRVFDILAAGLGVYTSGAFSRLGAGAYSQDFEAEADYVGLYLTARAGFAIDDAPNFWRRMAAAHPESIRDSHTSTHPASPHRFVALEKTVAEIKDKSAKGEALLPNVKLETSPQTEPMDQAEIRW